MSSTEIDENELVDYDEDELEETNEVTEEKEENKKGHYVGLHASGFRDFLLKPELLRAVVDCGFEHPSRVQHECIPQAILGGDILCQAKSGMGKTAVFVLASLHQLDTDENNTQVLVMAHTRELSFQIAHEYERFTKYMPDVKVSVFYGGIPIKQHRDILKNDTPHVLVGTPGRLKALVRDGDLDLKNIKHFVLDECDSLLQEVDMRSDVQTIFQKTPHQKQVMMFTATLPNDVRSICRLFLNNPMEILVDDDSKLTLHGLQQHYIKLTEEEKTQKLTDLLDALEFNQVVIFVRSVNRAKALNSLLRECNFPSICIHSGLKQPERISRYNQFKNFDARIMVATDIFGRGIDIERVNIVINYDMPVSGAEDNKGVDHYLHRVGRAGRFGTKGLAITFVSSSEDSEVLNAVQERFEVNITELPDSIEVSSYMNA